MSGALGGAVVLLLLVLLAARPLIAPFCHLCIPSCANSNCVQCAVNQCGVRANNYPRNNGNIRNCMYRNCVNINTCVFNHCDTSNRGSAGRENKTDRPKYSGPSLSWKGLKYGCGCHSVGSLQPTCDIVTGQCSCRPNVIGRTCNTCKEGHWGLATKQGCIPCDCDLIGSQNSSCNVHTGYCYCKPGVGGQKCDRCQPRYYGFSQTGCSECEPCDKPGRLCDPDTGRCICPPLTQGERCHYCQDNAWGFQHGKGCKACNCKQEGAIRQQCDPLTGRCLCREGYAGDQCDTCALHYHGFPHCRSCNCYIPGTKAEHCDLRTGQCLCDNTGQCPCKTNVGGKKCQQCKEGTFGLQADNPDGCTQCFCFGRTTACTQAGLTWIQIMMPRPRTLTTEYDTSMHKRRPDTEQYPVDMQEICFINLAVPGGHELNFTGTGQRLNVTNNLHVIPGDAGDVRMGVNYLFNTPIYWQLPQQFLGDKVLSYGGTLRFSVQTGGGNTLLPSHFLSTYPLIQLQGNNHIVLEHFPLLANPSGQYGVRLHESLWQMKNNPSQPVTREMLMVALQNVQHILIRASDSVDFTKVVLSAVTLDTAVAVPGQPPPLARGVELCHCPPEYNSTSCQDPSIGFYRWYDNSSISSTIVIQLVGEARPCQCSGRSRVCDIETGYCLGCSDNTGGPHCEQCAEGYYGNPAVAACKPCPCPIPNPGQNFATSCQVDRGKITCHCRKGHTGKRCDRCMYGWFGFPKQGSACTPCQCSIYGSVSDECDEETGQCNCRVGITGRDCSQCQDKHVLSPSGCQSCNDSCTGILLHELQELAALLKRKTGHISEGFIQPPWEPLEAIKNNSLQLRIRLQEWLDIANQAENFPDKLIEEFKRKAKLLQNKSKKLAKTSESGALDAATVETEAGDVLSKITELQENIQEVVLDLLNYGKGQPGAISVDAAHREAQNLLRDIQNGNSTLQLRNDIALSTMRKCEQQLKDIKQLLRDNTDLNPLRQGLERLSRRLEDLQVFLKNTSDILSKTRKLSSSNAVSLTKPRNNIKELLQVKNEVEILSDEAKFLANNASILLHEAKSNIMLLNADEEFLNLTKTIQEREGILDRLNPLYKEKYVTKAQEHADELFRWALYYRDLFNATRQDADFALRASQAYQGIVDALHNAQESAMNASIAAEVAYKTAHPGSLEGSLPEKSKQTEEKSKYLYDKALEKVHKVEEVQLQFEQQKQAVNKVRQTMKNVEEGNNAILQELQNLKSDGILKFTEEAVRQAEEALTISKEANATANMVSSDVNTKLRPLVAKLNEDQDLTEIEEKLIKAQNSINQSKQQWSMLKEKIDEQKKKFETWNNTIATKLQHLRNKITQARHTADGIHLSITSRADLGCVRTYKPANLAPSTTTSIILSYAVESAARDASLFYLSSDPGDEFIAVEMVNRTIRFVWNAGGGIGVVTHPRKIETAVLKEDTNWYRIQIERTSNIAKLSVRHQVLPDGSPEADGNPVTNTSEPGFSIVNVGPKGTVWVGGLPPFPPSKPKPPQLLSSSKGLTGCLHQLVLDGRPLGLWNFATETKNACTACIEGAEETKDEASYHFSGDGYSLHTTSYYANKLEFSLSLKFRSLDENALLFLGISKKKDQFIILMLRDGHVVFRIGYGENSHLELNTTKKFNTGKWIDCEALRFFSGSSEQAQLTVKSKHDSDSRTASPNRPPSEDDIPDLTEYVLGGIPPGFTLDSSTVKLPNGFLGCMSDIQVYNSGLNPLTGKFFGVEASCSLSHKIVSFQGKGYIHLEPHSLRRKKSSFEFVFRTVQSNTLLMLTTSDVNNANKGYYSASIHDGNVVVYVGIEGNRTILESRTSFNDGQLHALSVTKQGRKLELRVDDRIENSATLSNGDYTVKVSSKNGGLYFGGVPSTINVADMAASTDPLIGTIKDAIFNNQLIKFEEPIAFEHAAIGRLGPDSLLEDTTPLPPLPDPPSECHKVASYSLEPGAVKFGDSPDSYIQMNLGRKNNLQKDFTLQFGFRTHYPNGLLFIVPSSRKKQHPYMMAMLRNKRLNIETKSRKNKSYMLDAASVLNDGTWHQISLQKKDRNLTLSVDSKLIEHIKVPKKLNIGNVLYIGGLPKSGYFLSDKLVQSLEPFKGCIRQLRVNKQLEDLVGPKTLLNNVGQCFPEVERGSYFPGDAYAVYENEFQISNRQELELQFRTSELTGILLSVSEPSGSPALSLELNDGKVVMTCDTGDNKPLHVEHDFPSRFTICDNKWHSIHAFFVPHGLTLKVDNFPNRYGLSRNGGNTFARTSSPLYIGGLPDNATAGTLGTRDNFRGCIRKVVIGSKQKDWTDMAALENIHLNSCPLSS